MRLQEAGAVVLRDASANKCGVISSSYEIIGEPAPLRGRSSSRTRRSTSGTCSRSWSGAPPTRRGSSSGATARRAGSAASPRSPTRSASRSTRTRRALFAFFQSRPDLAAEAAVPQGAPRAPAAPRARDAGLARSRRAAAAEVPLGDPRGRDRRRNGVPAAARAGLRRRARGVRDAACSSEPEPPIVPGLDAVARPAPRRERGDGARARRKRRYSRDARSVTARRRRLSPPFPGASSACKMPSAVAGSSANWKRSRSSRSIMPCRTSASKLTISFQ